VVMPAAPCFLSKTQKTQCLGRSGPILCDRSRRYAAAKKSGAP
jgi:hypothetical protein